MLGLSVLGTTFLSKIGLKASWKALLHMANIITHRQKSQAPPVSRIVLHQSLIMLIIPLI